MSNLGAKISYTETSARDFIPSNLRMGLAYKTDIDDYNSLTVAFDANKLLVPTPPHYTEVTTGPDSGLVRLFSGMDPNVGVATGIVQSFYDAPGTLIEPIDGSDPYIVPGSRLGEEFREINLGIGLEYEFADVFAFRSGYFFEHWSKGNRQFINLGFGLKYTTFTIDMSYLVSTSGNGSNPLGNTLRFTLGLQFSELNQQTE